MAQVFDYSVGAEVPLVLRYLENGLPVSGLTVNVQLRDTKTGNYLDFADNTWKSSGWTQKQAQLSDLGDGSYQYDWNSALSVTSSMIVAAEFEVTSVGYEAESTDYILFGLHAFSPDDVAAAVWNRPTAAHTTPGTFGVLVKDTGANVSTIKEIETGRWKIENNQLILYASDNTTEIARFNLFDRDGQPTEDQVFDRVKL